MSKESDSFFGIVLGILGLVAVAKLIEAKKCPWCNENNPNNDIICRKCRRQI